MVPMIVEMPERLLGELTNQLAQWHDRPELFWRHQLSELLSDMWTDIAEGEKLSDRDLDSIAAICINLLRMHKAPCLPMGQLSGSRAPDGEQAAH